MSQDGRRAVPCIQPEKYRIRRDAIKNRAKGQRFLPAMATHHDCRLGFFGHRTRRLEGIEILLVCRQIYNEASKVPFTSNIFVFRQSGVLQRFCQRNGRTRVELIRSLVLEYLVDTQGTNRILLSGARNVLIFALLFEPPDHRFGSHSRLKTIAMLRRSMPILTSATVCLEYCRNKQPHREKFRAIESNLEEFLTRRSAIDSNTSRILEA